MKILNVNMSIDPVYGGGTAERTVQMSKALALAGHQCSLLTLDLGVSEKRKEELRNVELVALPCLNRRLYLPSFDFKKISQLVEKSDVVHLMGHWTLINVIVYLYIRRFKKKYVVCPAGALPLFGRSKYPKKIFNFLIGRSIIRNADSHIIITKDEIAHYKEYGVSEEKITWIPNGIDPTSFQSKNNERFRAEYHLGQNPFIFYIGRINPIKGPDLLVEAFARIHNEFPAYHLVVAGPDEGLENSLKDITSKNGLSQYVHFIGPIIGDTKSQALHASELMVIPSRQEAMSIVVLEGGVVGLPVVLTNQCGLNYLADINAGIVTPATVDGIAKGLRTLLSDHVNAKNTGENLKRHIHENYLWPVIIKKFEELYTKLLK